MDARSYNKTLQMSHPTPPLSLYIHIPWCIRKCPYCDFNSHANTGPLPEKRYIDALINDAKQYKDISRDRALSSIFIGGGTPSLISPSAYEHLFKALSDLFTFSDDIEITLEANPGTVEQQRFHAYRKLGINRLSLGIQSFDNDKLKRLGRIHSANEAKKAIDISREAGFDNLNLDIMHHLPEQTAEQALKDIQIAISFSPTHLSWYHLTIEPNTVFYSHPPAPPDHHIDDALDEIAMTLLCEYQQYEVSAYALPNRACRHNLNYWTYGDYIGIGAGAHGKLTQGSALIRTEKKRQPQAYLNNQSGKEKNISIEDRLFEFMLNTSRLRQPIPFSLFTDRTQLNLNTLMPRLAQANSRSLLNYNDDTFTVTSHGMRFLNDLQAIFLPN